MTTEQKQQIENIFRWLLIGVFSFCYSQGGMEDGGGLWIRRYLAPMILGVGCFILSWDWRYLACMPLQMTTLTIGYGSDVLILKLLKRAIWGLANGISFGSCIAWQAFYNAHLWAAFSLQVMMAFSGSICIGVWNPLPNARTEEFCIGVLLSLLPVMCARKKVTT